ncbi:MULTISPECIES: Gfo/Idh/MocA family protein [unclassified Bradyrhizobium]|uniref:Gfo/Idh/MocA family protein n=1 Tax=unclassified Bradyrhizobium TaxID=2631580 RepID=UPI001BAA1A05|nr:MULTISPECIES: Gfo/Idh/MocA family oxidoreductase [unclassified Bradyrhizobium]MBR1226025.1 Gfo/Idh/MocA family oxidoreductase [Bradyrhizobium sp. AUGA SZCCT0176]MBR1302443.1 Gfo/Idh/MocA family oxidoreductase [Bradyrhizobium sp. AUGA SZCCT0042]
MNKPLRVGLVGAGMVSRHHLIAWASIADQARVVAVADPSADNSARRATEFAISNTYASAEAMLAETELDAIDIAAPREMHAPLVRLAAAKRLPVLCQKPLAPNLQQATDLAAEVRDLTRLMVHENWRFRGYYRDAAAWLREGRIGNIKQAQLTLLTSGVLPGPDGLCPALERQPFMRREKRMLVAEVLIHHLDTLRMLLGPLRVTAAALSRSSEQLVGEDGAVIQLQTQNGAGVTVFASFAAHGHPATQIDRLEILGDKGAIKLDGPQLICSGVTPQQRVYDLATEYQGSYNRTIAHFVQSLRDNTPFETAPQDNLETLRLVEDCYRMSGWEALQ